MKTLDQSEGGADRWPRGQELDHTLLSYWALMGLSGLREGPVSLCTRPTSQEVRSPSSGSARGGPGGLAQLQVFLFWASHLPLWASDFSFFLNEEVDLDLSQHFGTQILWKMRYCDIAFHGCFLFKPAIPSDFPSNFCLVIVVTMK